MATWPAELPAPQIEGYRLSEDSTVIRTNMEAGLPKARRISVVTSDKIDCSVKLSDAQMAAFRTWYSSTTGANGGQSWFTVTLSVGQGGLDSVEARFSSPWSASIIGYMNWNVQMQLEVRYA
jgi:hypothetical protein